jgi:acetyl esterase/lipase
MICLMSNRWIFCATLIAGAIAWGSVACFAQTSMNAPAPLIVPLWKGPAPLSHGTGENDVPTLSVFLSKAPGPRPAVLIFPGGGYAFLSMSFEGYNIARWFQARGVSAFVVKYRLPKKGYRYPAPYLDAQRAIRLVRSRATEWGLDPQRVGVIGFSAGGHLAGLVATAGDDGVPNASDPVDQLPDRVNFEILVYPGITMESSGPNQQGPENFLGPNPDPQLRAQLSVDQRVTAQTPPTLLLYSQDDPTVPADTNSVAMAAALARANVPHEVDAFPTGGHGWGLGHRPERGPAHWIDHVEAWLKGQGFTLIDP